MGKIGIAKIKALLFSFLFVSTVSGFLLGSATEAESSDILLLEVIPHSLGIETAGGVMTKLIKRNSVIPTMKSHIITTYQDQQTTVYEGEGTLTKDCYELGSFNLSGILPVPRGMPQIEITFMVDANGILHVKAEDKASKNSKSVTIHDKRLSDEGIEIMVTEAEKFGEKDMKIGDPINKLEMYLNKLKIAINQKDIKMDSNYKEKIENKLKGTFKWLNDNQHAEKDDIDDKYREVEVCAMRL